MYPLEFSYSRRIIQFLREIDRAQGTIGERKVEEGWEKSFRFNARCHNIADALYLEGISSSYLMVKKILEGEYSPSDNINLQDTLNYNQALSYIDILASADSPISESAIKELNRMCLQGVVKAEKLQGNYRTIQNWVVNSEANEILYTPPSPESIPPLMQEFCAWINSDSFNSHHPVITAGLLHHRFLTLNPFVFANVRLACLLSRLILLRNGYDSRRWMWFEGLLARDIKNYYAKLYQNLKFDNITLERIAAWLEFYAEAIKSGCDYILQVSSEHQLKIKPSPPPLPATIPLSQTVAAPVASSFQLNERQRLIIELAKKYQTFHRRDINAELALTARYNPKTISRDLKSLVDKGYLIQGGARKGIYYSLNLSAEVPSASGTK